MMNTPETTQARLDAGLSYADIAAEVGSTKDAVRGAHKRWQAKQLDSTLLDIDLTLAAQKVSPESQWKAAPVEYPPYTLNFGWLDLEATNLNGSYGSLLAGCCAHSDGSVWTARLDDPQYRNKKELSDDKALAIALRNHFETHDIIFSWNGRRGMNPKGRGGFDVPMLNARLMPERIMRSSSQTHIDLLPVARRHLQLHSYRLAAVQEFLELQEEKTAILPRVWRLALQHDKAALDFVVDHCQRDVRVLQEVFWQFIRAGMLNIGIAVAKS